MDAASIAAYLARQSLFADLGPEPLAVLAQSMRSVSLRVRQPVFLQGDVADGFYCVLSGTLKVFTVSDAGKEAVMSILGPGACFGEIALLDGKARSASVVANSGCELAVLGRASFDAFLLRFPTVRERLIVALCERIRVLTDRVENLTTLDMPSRCARIVLALARNAAEGRPGVQSPSLRVTQTDLATMAGTSRESANKLLREWEAQGWIAWEDSGGLRVLQPDLLAQAGGMAATAAE